MAAEAATIHLLFLELTVALAAAVVVEQPILAVLEILLPFLLLKEIMAVLHLPQIEVLVVVVVLVQSVVLELLLLEELAVLDLLQL